MISLLYGPTKEAGCSSGVCCSTMTRVEGHIVPSNLIMRQFRGAIITQAVTQYAQDIEI